MARGRPRSRAEPQARPGRAPSPGVPSAIAPGCEALRFASRGASALQSRHVSCVWQHRLPADSRSVHLPGLGDEHGAPQCGTWASGAPLPHHVPPELGPRGPHGSPGPVCGPPSSEATAGRLPSSVLRASPHSPPPPPAHCLGPGAGPARPALQSSQDSGPQGASPPLSGLENAPGSTRELMVPRAHARPPTARPQEEPHSTLITGRGAAG